MRSLKRHDFIAPLIIGELIALIFLGIARFLELPDVVTCYAIFFPVLLPILSVLGVIIAAWIGTKIPSLFQFAKFALVGAGNTFIDLGVLNVLLWSSGIATGIWFSVFKTISFSTGVIHSFFWNKFWTFQYTDTTKTKKQFLLFYGITALGIIINVTIASIIVMIIGPQFGLTERVWANVAAIIATICVALWNFLGYKLIVFKTESTPDAPGDTSSTT